MSGTSLSCSPLTKEFSRCEHTAFCTKSDHILSDSHIAATKNEREGLACLSETGDDTRRKACVCTYLPGHRNSPLALAAAARRTATPTKQQLESFAHVLEPTSTNTPEEEDRDLRRARVAKNCGIQQSKPFVFISPSAPVQPIGQRIRLSARPKVVVSQRRRRRSREKEADPPSLVTPSLSIGSRRSFGGVICA